MSHPGISYTLAELSEQFQLELMGDGDHVISAVATLKSASTNQLSFLANPAYRKDLLSTQAGVVVLNADAADDCKTNCLVADDPYLAYARIAALFDPRPRASQGIHPSAVVHESAKIGESVAIGANVVIGASCVIGRGSTIGAGTVIDESCTLGESCLIYSNVSLGYGVSLGDRVIIHPGVVIGADGFGIAFAQDHWEKVPQLGSVRIGNDCEIGANTTIDRGAIEDTVLEDDVRIDNQVQVAHNVHIGAHTAVAGMAGIAGSTRIGRYCLLAGNCGIAGHLEIADRTTVAADTAIFKSIKEPGQTWSNQVRARPIREWQRTAARLNKLDDWAQRLQALEKHTERESKK